MSLLRLRPRLQPGSSLLSISNTWIPQRSYLTASYQVAKEEKALEDVEVRVIKRSHCADLLGFLRMHHYPYDPLTIGVRPLQQDSADEQHKEQLVGHGLSLMAVRPEEIRSRWNTFNIKDKPKKVEKIVGTVLASPKTLYDSILLMEKSRRLGGTKWGQAMKFMACIEREANVCKRYGVRNALQAHLLAVDDTMRGEGLGECLLLELFQHAQRNRFPLVTFNCVSTDMAQLCDSLGMDLVSTIYYKDYKNAEGQPVFRPPPPNDAVNTYAKFVHIFAKINSSKIRPWLRPLNSLLAYAKSNQQRRNLTSSTNQHGEQNEKNRIDIRLIKFPDREELLDFLRIHYYLQDPLTIGAKSKRPDPADEEYHMSLIHHGLSLMAVEKSTEDGEAEPVERIVGAVVAGPQTPTDAWVFLEESHRLGPTQWGETMKFLACIERDSDICKRYGVSKALKTKILAVEEDQDQGLAKRLMLELFLHAQRHRYPLVTYDCTTEQGAKLCEKLGMEYVSTMYYRDFKNSDGEQVFRPPEPYETMTTFAKWVW